MIWVDDYRGKFGRMIMSHMVSDTSLEELHEFAADLGLRREWFQNEGSTPHYDVCQSKRQEAIRLGAKPVSCRSDEWRKVFDRARALK